MLTIVSQVSVMFWGGQRPNPMHNIWEMALKRDQEYCSPTVAFWRGTLTTNCMKDIVKCRASVTLARVWCTILTVQNIDHHIRYNHTNNVVWTQPGWMTKQVSCNHVRYGHACINLKAVDGNPWVVWDILQDWDQELDAAIPVSQQEHQHYQFWDP